MDGPNIFTKLVGSTSNPTICTLSGTKDSSVVLWRVKRSYLFIRIASGKHFEGILQRNKPRRLDSMNDGGRKRKDSQTEEQAGVNVSSNGLHM